MYSRQFVRLIYCTANVDLGTAITPIHNAKLTALYVTQNSTLAAKNGTRKAAKLEALSGLNSFIRGVRTGQGRHTLSQYRTLRSTIRDLSTAHRVATTRELSTGHSHTTTPCAGTGHRRPPYARPVPGIA
eukprot:1633927-Rhodomonas_salina.3